MRMQKCLWEGGLHLILQLYASVIYQTSLRSSSLY
uniref:Uncharacterized protein n=1 Tax=Arundo donax TaxID=35708 RepID=A0A0A9DYF9_ARUDO